MRPQSGDEAYLEGLPDSKASQDAVAVAQESLTRSLSNVFITEGDVGRATSALLKLPAGHFKAALEALQRDGVLEDLAERMSPEQRRAFLAHAEKLGVISWDGPQPEASKAPCQPPAPVRLYDNAPWLPRGLRDMVHAENLTRARAYYGAYNQYQERFIAAVDAAKTPEDLRKLGNVQDPFIPSEGFVVGDPGKERYSGHWDDIALHRPSHDADKALSNKIDDLRGEARAGSFAAYAGVAVEEKVKLPGAGEAKLKAEAQVKVRDYGKVTTKAEAEVKVKAGSLHVKAKAKSDEKDKAEVELKETVSAGPLQGGMGIAGSSDKQGVQEVHSSGFSVGDVGYTRDVEDGPNGSKVTHTVDLGFAKVKSEEGVKDGKPTWEKKARVFGFEVKAKSDGEASVGFGLSKGTEARAYWKPKDAVFGGEARVEAMGVKVFAGGEGKTIPKKDVDRIVREFVNHQDSGLSALTPLIDAGVPWNKLSADDRERAESLGYDAALWSRALSTR